jgi:hypothetical protein
MMQDTTIDFVSIVRSPAVRPETRGVIEKVGGSSALSAPVPPQPGE